MSRSSAHRIVLAAAVCTVLLVAGCSAPQAGADDEAPRRDRHVITEEEIDASSEESLEGLLATRIPGVRIVSTGSGLAVHIRGRHSVQSQATPLYVLDGMPIEAGPDGSIAVNVRDIASIEVRKPSEAGIYANEGGNGVVLITTKRR